MKRDMWAKGRLRWVWLGLVVLVSFSALGGMYLLALVNAPLIASFSTKPILALFRDTGERSLSAMIDGSPSLEVARYIEIDQARLAIDGFIRSLK